MWKFILALIGALAVTLKDDRPRFTKGTPPADLLIHPLDDDDRTRVLSWREMIEPIAARLKVPRWVVLGTIAVESRGVATARGSAGEIGLMQVMSGAISDVRRDLNITADPHTPAGNAEVGIGYLALVHRWTQSNDWLDTFRAYNAGIGNWRKNRTVSSKYADTVAWWGKELDRQADAA